MPASGRKRPVEAVAAFRPTLEASERLLPAAISTDRCKEKPNQGQQGQPGIRFDPYSVLISVIVFLLRTYVRCVWDVFNSSLSSATSASS